MIAWIILISMVVVRLLLRPFYFSTLNFFILLAYVVTLATLIGRVKWSLFWVLGTSLGSILAFFLFMEGEYYILIYDFFLFVIAAIALFTEDQLKKKKL